MGFNYKVSLFTFFIGTVFSILLIKYGNPIFFRENTTSGIFTIFIAMIQFMDFLFWIDLKNKLGINTVTTILGPILNAFQPVIFYIIKYIYFQPNIFSAYNFSVFLLNVLYTIYFIIQYITFLLKGPLLTHVKKGHLSWPWIPYYNPSFYLILLAINIFYLFQLSYALTLFSITYFFLFISVKYFSYHEGEIWCFFGSFIPLLLFFASFFIV